MPRGILKLQNKYCVWSTVVDAPVTNFDTRERLEMYWRDEYGRQGMNELPSLLRMVEETGTSFRGTTAAELIEGNRAGPDESELTESLLLEHYAARLPGD